MALNSENANNTMETNATFPMFVPLYSYGNQMATYTLPQISAQTYPMAGGTASASAPCQYVAAPVPSDGLQSTMSQQLEAMQPIWIATTGAGVGGGVTSFAQPIYNSLKTNSGKSTDTSSNDNSNNSNTNAWNQPASQLLTENVVPITYSLQYIWDPKIGAYSCVRPPNNAAYQMDPLAFTANGRNINANLREDNEKNINISDSLSFVNNLLDSHRRQISIKSLPHLENVYILDSSRFKSSTSKKCNPKNLNAIQAVEPPRHKKFQKSPFKGGRSKTKRTGNAARTKVKSDPMETKNKYSQMENKHSKDVEANTELRFELNGASSSAIKAEKSSQSENKLTLDMEVNTDRMSEITIRNKKLNNDQVEQSSKNENNIKLDMDSNTNKLIEITKIDEKLNLDTQQAEKPCQNKEKLDMHDMVCNTSETTTTVDDGTVENLTEKSCQSESVLTLDMEVNTDAAIEQMQQEKKLDNDTHNCANSLQSIIIRTQSSHCIRVRNTEDFICCGRCPLCNSICLCPRQDPSAICPINSISSTTERTVPCSNCSAIIAKSKVVQ